MARPRLPLKGTYGNLTVLSDMGGEHALVECKCGRRKWVLRSNLRAGRVSSCGQPGCRTYVEARRPRRAPDAPTWLPLGAIANVHTMAVSLGLAHAAQELGVEPSKVQSLLDAIEAHGGVDAYVAYVTGKGNAPAAPQLTEAPPLVLGSAPPPPPKTWSTAL